jgi:hypothetical protein
MSDIIYRHNVSQHCEASKLFLYRLHVLTKDYELIRARTNITTAHAGNTVRIAIYQYDNTHTHRKLILLRGSKAIFKTDTTGLKTELVDFQLLPNTQYYMGGIVSSTTMAVMVAQAEEDATEPFLTVPATDFPDVVNLNLVTKEYCIMAPTVDYYSKEATEIYL